MRIIKQISKVKNPFAIGFVISLLGALPLGYINVINLQILLIQGNFASNLFILGVVSVSFLMLKTTSVFAEFLISQKKLTVIIQWFTLIFFLLIGIYFVINRTNTDNFSSNHLPFLTHPFFLGIFLNALNFIQWPYWSGIFVFLFQHKIITKNPKGNYPFILGAVLGIFVGMNCFAQASRFLLADYQAIFSYYLNTIFAVLFITLAIIQALKLFIKQTHLPQ